MLVAKQKTQLNGAKRAAYVLSCKFPALYVHSFTRNLSSWIEDIYHSVCNSMSGIYGRISRLKKCFRGKISSAYRFHARNPRVNCNLKQPGKITEKNSLVFWSAVCSGHTNTTRHAFICPKSSPKIISHICHYATDFSFTDGYVAANF